MERPGERELRSLEQSPRSSALLAVLSGASILIVAASLGVRSVSALVVASLAVGTSVAWVVVRATRARAEIAASVDSIGARLTAWTEGRAPDPVVAHAMTRALGAACVDLVARLERAEREASRHRAAAEEADRERLGFLADFSHELRTPLNSILGFAHILESGAEGPLGADGVEAVGVIVASGEQLRALVEDVLDLTALETGAMELSPRPVDLGAAASEVTRAAQVVANQKKLEVVRPSAPLVFAMGDEKRLRRVFWNLITRAIRVTDEGQVLVGVEEVEGDPGRAVFFVEDVGRAPTPLELRALSEGFLDEATTREGVGIGLAVAGRLISRLRGRIDVASHGRRTRIRVELQRATPDEVSSAEQSRPSMRGGRRDPEAPR